MMITGEGDFDILAFKMKPHLTIFVRYLHSRHLFWIMLDLFHNLTDHVDKHLALFF